MTTMTEWLEVLMYGYATQATIELSALALGILRSLKNAGSE